MRFFNEITIGFFSDLGDPVDIMAREIVCAGSAVLCKKICGALTSIPHVRD
jgi:hypothetical protein